MSLRTKSFLIVAGTALVLLGVLVVAGRRIILESALALERETVALDVSRAAAAFPAEADRLRSFAREWTARDEVCAAFVARDPSRLRGLLTDEALRRLDARSALLVDASGRLVAERRLRAAAGAAASAGAGDLSKLVAREPGAWLVQERGRSGLAALDGEAMLVASRPILCGGSARPLGALVLARGVDPDRALAAAKVAHVGSELRPLADPALPPAVRAALGWTTDRDPVAVVPRNFRVITGYTLLEDLAGNRSLVLAVPELRAVYVQGVRSLGYFVGALGIAVLSFGLAVAVLLERLVLSRLSRLSARVQRIGGASDLSLRVEVTGGDEMASLGSEVNGMLQRLEDAHTALEGHRAELEERVRERTAELETLNATLHTEIGERVRTEGQLRALQGELERQNRELRTLDRMKDALIGDVSHELRTPVAKQAMQLELLREELERRGLAEELAGPLRVMDGALRRQQSVIRNILTLSRLEAGGREVQLAPVRLDELIREVVEDYRVTLGSCGIAVAIDVPPVTLQSERELLWHVFSNLVSNAVKYRGTVDPRVEITASREEGRVRVRVVDNGVGFSAQTRARIFERFYQESAAVEGIGLGLHIVQSILRKLGGTVTIDSPGKDLGTVAEVVLPLTAPAG